MAAVGAPRRIGRRGRNGPSRRSTPTPIFLNAASSSPTCAVTLTDYDDTNNYLRSRARLPITQAPRAAEFFGHGQQRSARRAADGAGQSTGDRRGRARGEQGRTCRSRPNRRGGRPAAQPCRPAPNPLSTQTLANLSQQGRGSWMEVEVTARRATWRALSFSLLRSGVTLVVDHFGRPDAMLGVDDPGPLSFVDGLAGRTSPADGLVQKST